MKKHSLNDKVILYPTEKGWRQIRQNLCKEYNLNSDLLESWMDNRITPDGCGYTDQLWVIIQDHHNMFYNGQTYFKNTDILFFK